MLGAFLATHYSNLFFLLLAFLCLQWFFCGLWTWANVRGLRATLSEFEARPAGSGSSVRAWLHSPRGARYHVALELDLVRTQTVPEGSARTVQASAVVVERETLVLFELPPLERGIYELRRARIASSFPFGMLQAHRAVESAGELVVYPRPKERGEVAQGEVVDPLEGLTGSGDLQPAGLRDRRDNDDLRSIHWRASARRGTLVVKEWEGGLGEGHEVLIDRRAEPEALEDAFEAVSALVVYARANKERLTIHSQGLQSTFGPGHRPWHEALRFLAAAEPLAAGDVPPPRVSPSVTRLPVHRFDRSA